MRQSLLSPHLTEKLQAHGARGRAAWQAGDIETAESEFLSAWDVLPEPKLDHDYAQSLSSGLVIFFRDTHQVEKARHWLDIMRAAYASDDPTYHDFITATVEYEAGEWDRAFTLFDAEYKRFKKRPFEDEAPKYLDFYLKRVKLSP